MKRKYIYAAGIILIIAALFAVWLSVTLSKKSSLPSRSETIQINDEKRSFLSTEEIVEDRKNKIQEVEKKILSVLNTSISFQGKVIDQNGSPVSNAAIGFSLLNSFNSSGSNGEVVADEDGHFTITGVKGAVLGVNVKKQGYYQIHNVSNQRFAYSVGPDGYTKLPPTAESPAIFVLHKKGLTEPLIHVSSKQYKLPPDGTPTDVNLEQGRTTSSGKGHITFECLVDDKNRNERGNYDWKFSISIPKGGLIERKGDFNFIAPESGYASQIEINMPASLGDKWNWQVEKDFFIKLADGRFARVHTEIYGRLRINLYMEIFLNPVPGNRNLEFDPSKEIKIK